MCGSTAIVVQTVPQNITRIASSKSSIVVASIGPTWMMPALFTRTSMRLKIQSRRHQRLNLQAIAYVARGGEYFHPGPSKIFCRPIKFFLAAGAQYKFRVLLREPSGERKTQTM